MASRIPRVFQRVVYRHRRSIVLLYSESKELQRRLNTRCLPQPTDLLNIRPKSIFPDENKQFSINSHAKYDNISTLWKHQKNFIQFQTFNHPKIDHTVFEQNLKQFWNFVPTTKSKMNKDHVAAIEFEHESGSPCYPTIVVNQLHHEHLSKNIKELIDRMIHTIPNNQQLNPSKSENFLVCGRIWEPITNEQFDLVNQESKFAASLSVSGIFPKKAFSTNDISSDIPNETLPVVSSTAVQAMQAGINLQHVIPSSSLRPTANVTFREMLATSASNNNVTLRAIQQGY